MNKDLKVSLKCYLIFWYTCVIVKFIYESPYIDRNSLMWPSVIQLSTKRTQVLDVDCIVDVPLHATRLLYERKIFTLPLWKREKDKKWNFKLSNRVYLMSFEATFRRKGKWKSRMKSVLSENLKICFFIYSMR